MSTTEPAELAKKVWEFGEWLRDHGAHFNAVENLREVWVGTKQPFLKLSEKQFLRWYHMREQPPEKMAKPHEPTINWILALDACRQQPADHLEILKKLDLPERFLKEIGRDVRPAAVPSAPYPQMPPDPQKWCQSALEQAGLGHTFAAWQHLRMTITAYAKRDDVESAMALVPTLINITYRHFPIDRLAETATIIRQVLAPKRMSKCNPVVRRLAAVHVGAALTEHGEGRKAQDIFNAADVKALVHDNAPLPWPKGQLMRVMAAHVALHDSHPEKALEWLNRAALGADPSSLRSIAAMSYTVSMQLGAMQTTPKAQREYYGKAYEHMRPYHERSCELLRSKTITGNLLHVCNDVYLGTVAKHFSGTAYDQHEKTEDIRALRWGLGQFETPRPQMEDQLMRYPVNKLFEELGTERTGLIRTAFSSQHSSVLEDVIGLADVLLDKRSD